MLFSRYRIMPYSFNALGMYTRIADSKNMLCQELKRKKSDNHPKPCRPNRPIARKRIKVKERKT